MTAFQCSACYVVGSSFLFAVMGVCVKVASSTLPNEEIVFFRNVVALIALLPWIWRWGFRRLPTRCFSMHLTRSIVGLSAMYCFFYAIRHMFLADVTLLNYTTPLLLPLVAWVWLQEKIPVGLWIDLGIGFIGVVLLLKPGPGILHSVAPVALLAAFLAAVAQTSIRQLTRTEPTTRIVFYFSIISTAVSFVPMLIRGYVVPARELWIALGVMGASASAAQMFLTAAFSQAPAAQVGPFIYTSVLFAAFFDWSIFGKLPAGNTVAGAILVCSAGVLAIRRRKIMLE